MRIFLTLIAAASTCALAGCAEGSGDGSGDGAGTTPAADATPSPEPSPDTDIAVAESGWLTVGSDGAVQRTYFDPDGRYRDLRNGEPFGEGTWEQRPDGRVCFEPDSGRGACWETEKSDENGIASAVDGDGKRIRIQQITYIAPPEAE